MEKAIKRAIEGGYRKGDPFLSPVNPMRESNIRYACKDKDKINEALLDPSFWQALGKAEGWGLVDKFYCRNKDCKQYNDKNNSWTTRGYCRFCGVMQLQYSEQTGNPDWKFQMHRFIDHIIEGKPIDEFFNNLLK